MLPPLTCHGARWILLCGIRYALSCVMRAADCSAKQPLACSASRQWHDLLLTLLLLVPPICANRIGLLVKCRCTSDKVPAEAWCRCKHHRCEWPDTAASRVGTCEEGDGQDLPLTGVAWRGAWGHGRSWSRDLHDIARNQRWWHFEGGSGQQRGMETANTNTLRAATAAQQGQWWAFFQRRFLRRRTHTIVRVTRKRRLLKVQSS